MAFLSINNIRDSQWFVMKQEEEICNWNCGKEGSTNGHGKDTNGKYFENKNYCNLKSNYDHSKEKCLQTDKKRQHWEHGRNKNNPRMY